MAVTPNADLATTLGVTVVFVPCIAIVLMIASQNCAGITNKDAVNTSAD
ncbi:MAG: hypothetical protein ABJB03_06145 [Rhodoglobus sp.]